MRRGKNFSGDKEATIGKAKSMLRAAQRQVGNLKEDESPEARLVIRQAAETGWFAMTTAADAYMREREGKKTGAENTKEVSRVYGNLGDRTLVRYGTVRGVLHISCGYSDDKTTCKIPVVKANLREAGLAIAAVEYALAKKRKK